MGTTPSSPQGPSDPSGPPTDDDRRRVIDRIQQALAEDRIAFEELDRRFEAVYGATTASELEAITSDLPELHSPPPPVPARHLAPSSRLSLIGDVKIGGWLAVEDGITVTSLIGDTTIDLSSAHLDPGGVRIVVRSLIGDVKIIVPDGARVQAQVNGLIGDDRQVLVPPVAGGPTIRIQTFSVVGDAQVYSLSLVPPGPLRRLWATLRSK